MDWLNVPGMLFKPSGKWMYDVTLDYGLQPPLPWVNCNENARRALHRATLEGTSGVVIADIPEGWHLVVPEPPEGFPVMVHGEAAK